MRGCAGRRIGPPGLSPDSEGERMTEHTIRPLPGWDWAKVNWGGPDDPRTENCSYCGVKLPDIDDPGYEIPLIIWTKAGHCAEFCIACQAQWWGLEVATVDRGFGPS